MHKMSGRIMAAALAAAGLTAGAAAARNPAVSKTALQSLRENKARVEFDLAWDNSWRNSVNHDACWVFVKFSTDNGASWRHATLGAAGLNPEGFAPGTGAPLEIAVPPDRRGAFIRRAAEGRGAVANTKVQLIWDGAANGVSNPKQAQVRVLAVDMVHVAAGPFHLGDGADRIGVFTAGPRGSGRPFLITNEAAEITLGGGGAGSLGNNRTNQLPASAGYGDDFSDQAAMVLPAAFPKGFAAFYCMKHELTQGQYVDFLNLLAPAQAAARVPTNLTKNCMTQSPAAITENTRVLAGGTTWQGIEALRNSIGVNTAGAYTSAAPDLACNALSWMDGLAYADWAGLRPMTELEFEKACRGPLKPVPGEFAWGATNLVRLTGYALDGRALDGRRQWPEITDTVRQTAGAVPSAANCNYGWGLATGFGPARAGLFDRADGAREPSGASYWGIMELSGNLWESVVPVGLPAARLFTGEPGDGELAANGEANVPGWPGQPPATTNVPAKWDPMLYDAPAAGAPRQHAVIGYRGGSFAITAGGLPVAYRGAATGLGATEYTGAAQRYTVRWRGVQMGWRFVRPAP